MYTLENFVRFLKNYITKKDNILDIGCGKGEIVKKLYDEGYIVTGIDVKFYESPYYLEDMIKSNTIRKIPTKTPRGRDQTTGNLKWPIRDKSIDFSFSRTVVEHVSNLENFIKELSRVTKSNSISIHYFPSKYSLIECHVGVPFGGCFINLSYFKICHKLGLMNKRPEDAFDYMNKYTFYRPYSEIENLFIANGFVVKDITRQFLSNHDNWKGRFISKSKILTKLFTIFRSKVYYCKKL